MAELGVRAVSADSHVNPPTEMWAEYLAPEFRDRAPVVEHTDEADLEVFEGRRRPLSGLSAAAGKRPEEYTTTIRRFDEVRPGGWSPAPRIEDQDIDGVDAEVLFGSLGTPLPSRDPALTRAGYTAYNRWLADFCVYAPARLIGMAYVPCNDVDDAIAEIRAAAALGLRGAVLPTEPPGPFWGDDEWDPLWHTLVELGWAAHFHISGSTRALSRPREAGADAFMNFMVASKLDMPLSLGTLVLSGVLARHPQLKVVSVEGQIGWIPFWKYYLDRVYEKHRWHLHMDLGERPSFFIDRQIWYTFMEDAPGVEARHRCGVDRVMWSSDYPHSETTWPHSQKIIGEIFERVPADDVKRIVRDNCVELYGLDVD